MPNATLAALEAQVRRNTEVEASATLLINGFGSRLATAIAAAIANGATAEELAPVQAEVDALKASADSLGEAVAANTPGA